MADRGLDAFEDMHETDERVLAAARDAIERGRRSVSKAAHGAMVGTYWTIGKEVTEAVGERAAYGKHLIAFLSEHLTAEFGRGFSARTLREARQFYRTFPIWRTVCAKLSWSHYRRIMRLESEDARQFYIRESEASNWSLAQLKRNIDTHLYERLLHTQEAEALKSLPSGKLSNIFVVIP